MEEDSDVIDVQSIMAAVRKVVDTWSLMWQCSRRTWHPALHLYIHIDYNVLKLINCFFTNKIDISTKYTWYTTP